MDYVRVSPGLLEDGRLRRLSDALRPSELPSIDDAIGKLVRLWAWALRVAGPKGDLSSRRVEEAAIACGIEVKNAVAFASALRASGFISEDGCLVGWTTWTGRLLNERNADRKRWRKRRAKSRSQRSTPAECHAEPPPECHAESVARATPGLNRGFNPGLNKLKLINKYLTGTRGKEREEGGSAAQPDENYAGNSLEITLGTGAENYTAILAQLDPPSPELPAAAPPSPTTPEPPLLNASATPGPPDSKSGPTPRPATPKPSEALPAIPAEIDTPAFREAWELFLRHRLEKRVSVKPTHAGMLLRKLALEGETAATTRLTRSVENGWTGLFFPDDGGPSLRKKAPKIVLGPDHDEKYADLEPKKAKVG